ncbi:MAG: hypothetical protein OXJ54_14595 [Gemmatimonadetes bacterium]|nr:hypothetical protein [Candidatus Palauibacter rhopaloidicola]
MKGGSFLFIITTKASMWVLAVLLIGPDVVSFALAVETGGGGSTLWLSLAVAVLGPPLGCGPVSLLRRSVEALEKAVGELPQRTTR